MEQLYTIINNCLRVLLVFIFSCLVVDVLWQVLARYGIGKPFAFTEELARYLLIWLAILGTAYVRSYKGQMSIDYVYNKLSAKKQRTLSYFIEFCIMLFALMVMIVGGINLISITLELGQISPALNVPMGYVYSVVPISGFLILFYSTYHCITLFNNKIDNSNILDHDFLKTNL